MSMATAAWLARPTTSASAGPSNTARLEWPKNSPPSTLPWREVTGTAR